MTIWIDLAVTFLTLLTLFFSCVSLYYIRKIHRTTASINKMRDEINAIRFNATNDRLKKTVLLKERGSKIFLVCEKLEIIEQGGGI